MRRAVVASSYHHARAAGHHHAAATAAAAAPSSTRRLVAYFSEQAQTLQRAAKAHGYQSNVWIEEGSDRRRCEKAGFKVRTGQRPLVTTVPRRFTFYNVDQLATASEPFPVVMPFDLNTQRELPALISRCLLEAMEERGYSSNWWATSNYADFAPPASNAQGTHDSSLGSQIVHQASTPVIVMAEVTAPLFNVDQFEDPTALTNALVLGKNRHILLAEPSKDFGFAGCILEAAAKRAAKRPALYFHARALHYGGYELAAGATPIFLPPNEKLKADLTLFNIEELVDGPAFARAHGADVATASHREIVQRFEIQELEAELGPEAFAFGSRLWVFGKNLSSPRFQTKPMPGCTGRVFLPRRWAERHGLAVYLADDLVNPAAAYALCGFDSPAAKWATKTGDPPRHLQRLLEQFRPQDFQYGDAVPQPQQQSTEDGVAAADGPTMGTPTATSSKAVAMASTSATSQPSTSMPSAGAMHATTVPPVSSVNGNAEAASL